MPTEVKVEHTDEESIGMIFEEQGIPTTGNESALDISLQVYLNKWSRHWHAPQTSARPLIRVCTVSKILVTKCNEQRGNPARTKKTCDAKLKLIRRDILSDNFMYPVLRRKTQQTVTIHNGRELKVHMYMLHLGFPKTVVCFGQPYPK